MTVDARYRLACSLGVVIQGSWQVDAVGSSWLVSTGGSLTIDGNQRILRGTPCKMAYEYGGSLHLVPHRLYVIHSTANPRDRTTTVEIGDRLRLMADRKAATEAESDSILSGAPPPSWWSVLTEEQRDTIAYPTQADWVLRMCAARVGCRIDPASYKLTSHHLGRKVDLTKGYVATMRDLLKSESCYGVLAYDETIKVRRVIREADTLTGPVLDEARIAALEPLGAGEAYA